MSRFGSVAQYFARQEIILSAGTIGSPQLLLLSGVGDTEHLQQVGVAPLHHSPEVGQNLQDHLIVGTDQTLVNAEIRMLQLLHQA